MLTSGYSRVQRAMRNVIHPTQMSSIFLTVSIPPHGKARRFPSGLFGLLKAWIAYKLDYLQAVFSFFFMAFKVLLVKVKSMKG